jgi:hypothetical protein
MTGVGGGVGLGLVVFDPHAATTSAIAHDDARIAAPPRTFHAVRRPRRFELRIAAGC